MNHLLVIPFGNTVPGPFVESLRGAGWRISVAPNARYADHLLRSNDIEAVIIGSDPAGDGAEECTVLRSVYQLHPQAMVVMVKSSLLSSDGTGRELIKTLNVMEGARGDKTSFAAWVRLSPAQKRIAELVAQAYPNREIARILKIKEQSVRNELSRIFKKVSVRSRVELAVLMRADGREPARNVADAPWRPDLPKPASLPLPAGTASDATRH